MEVYFIRHTTPEVEKGICYGQTDLTLLDAFEDQKRELIKALPERFDAIYSSPLQRCSILANSLRRDEELILDDRLKEVDFGSWEMMAWDNIPSEEVNPWMSDFVNEAPPNGESMVDLQRRVLDWWEEVIRRKSDTIAVVTHAGVIRIMNAFLNDIPLKNAFDDFSIEYGGVKKFEFPEIKIE
ncbi:MAG: alpha-ribazole phosphatase [Cyclobacteriaceae bacterium]